MSNITITLIFVMLRLVLCVRYFAYDSAVAWLFGLSELSVLYFTASTLRNHRLDMSQAARLAPFCYMTPLLLQPVGNGYDWAMWILSFLCFVQLGLRLWMGKQVTIGVPKWGSLINTGPYHYMRHPLALSEMGIVISFTLFHLSTWNVVACWVALVAMRHAVHLEEKFLQTIPAYRQYMAFVPNRFIPSL